VSRHLEIGCMAMVTVTKTRRERAAAAGRSRSGGGGSGFGFGASGRRRFGGDLVAVTRGSASRAPGRRRLRGGVNG
jgi:hypothetical protein